MAVLRMLIRASPKSMFAKTKKGSTPAAIARQAKGNDFQEEIVGILERSADESFCRGITGSGYFRSGDSLEGGSTPSGFTASVSSQTVVSW